MTRFWDGKTDGVTALLDLLSPLATLVKKSSELDTKTCQKPNEFDTEVKGQHRIGNTNVRETSS